MKALAEVAPALQRLPDTANALDGLGDAVETLQSSVASLNAAVTPLQGTAERVGRMVDRLPRKRAATEPD
jgi:hypothetical protein